MQHSSTTTRRALIRLLAALAALLLFASSCGSDGEEAVASEVVSDVLEDDEQDPPDDEGSSGGGSGDFCAAAAKVDETLDAFGLGLSPEELEQTITDSRDQMQVAIDNAPGDIRPAVETSAEAFGIMADAIEAAGYNMLDVDLSVVNELDADPKYEVADRELDVYLFENCGVGTDPALSADDQMEDPDTESPLPEGSVRDQIITELENIGMTTEEAECLSNRSDLLEVMTSNDVPAILAAFEECGIPPERLVELTP